MALDPEKALLVEEFKEVGHEYRYREQLMVQEFGFCMLTMGVVAGVIVSQRGTLFSVIVQFFGLLFLSLLSLHLRNINQDRRAALQLKEKILEELKFRPIHQNVSGRKRNFISISAPRTMVWFAVSLAVGWALWLVISARSLVRHSCRSFAIGDSVEQETKAHQSQTPGSLHILWQGRTDKGAHLA